MTPRGVTGTSARPSFGRRSARRSRCGGYAGWASAAARTRDTARVALPESAPRLSRTAPSEPFPPVRSARWHKPRPARPPPPPLLRSPVGPDLSGNAVASRRAWEHPQNGGFFSYSSSRENSFRLRRLILNRPCWERRTTSTAYDSAYNSKSIIPSQ